MKTLKPVIVLTLIAFFCTAALAGVNFITRDIIAKAAEDAKQAALNEMIEDADGFETVDISEEILAKYNVTTVYKEKQNKGYVVEAASKGYGGDISMMVAFSPDGKIGKLKVLSHSETKGVGTRAVESEDYLNSFTDKNVKDGGEIDGISGATISSKGVANGVSNASMLIAGEILG